MAKRKSISKKMRFEVFKRDKFTCQYCGKSAPDVVLEVDHIKPVAKGGTNDIMNLITSCMECNRGKSDKELSDDSVVKKQQRQIQELSERREQLEMMLEWRESMRDIHDYSLEKAMEIFHECTGYSINENGQNKISKWIKEFSLEEVLDAIDIAISAYYNGDHESTEIVFSKIPGICYNRRVQKTDKRNYYYNYIVKAMDMNGWYYNKNEIKDFVYDVVDGDEGFDLAKFCLKKARNWTTFWEQVAINFEYYR